MLEVTGNMWDYANKPGYVLCITTNGFVKKNGEAVMGRGCAKEAAGRYPMFPTKLGTEINISGNKAFWFVFKDQEFLTFPVKHNWWEKADLELIKECAEFLRQEATIYKLNIYVLPRPGCGNGQLKWEQVKPLMETLPDNVWCIDFVQN